MMSLRRLLLALVLVGAAPLAAGCASDCASKCPVIMFEAQTSSAESLNVMTASWTGPACPANTPLCRGLGTSCQWFDIVGTAQGTCDLTVTFTDGRPTFMAHVEFGPAVTQGCCQGFPVVGQPIVMIPPLGGTPDAEADAPADAATD